MTPANFLTSGLTTAVKQFLTDTGRAAGSFQHDLAAYIADLAPLVEANAAGALAGDDVAQSNLGYLADLAILHASHLAENFKATELDQLSKTVESVVRGFLAMAVNAIAPGVGTAIDVVVTSPTPEPLSLIAPVAISAVTTPTGQSEASEALPPAADPPSA